MNDLILIPKMKKGDKDAFTSFIIKYYDTIFSYCKKRCSDSYMAEDFTQETFLHFSEALSSYTFRGKTLNYLYTIANNIIINEYKRKKAYVTDDDNILDASSESVYTNEDEIIIQRQYCENLIKQLPQEFKDIIILYYYKNLTMAEISSSLNISLSLVKYRLGRAKELLKECAKNAG